MPRSDCQCSQRPYLLNYNDSEPQGFLEDLFSFHADIFENESYLTKDSMPVVYEPMVRQGNRDMAR